jgi:glycerophosphoryl diester phosphodiesterase
MLILISQPDDSIAPSACRRIARRGQQRNVDLQGQRGARGLWPENTLAGFTGAMQLGMSVLELDCGVARQGVVA